MLSPLSRLPAWEELELHSHRNTDTLELCLVHRGRPVGFSFARDNRERGPRWLEPPSGLDWAVELLREATDEWLRIRSTEIARSRDLSAVRLAHPGKLPRAPSRAAPASS